MCFVMMLKSHIAGCYFHFAPEEKATLPQVLSYVLPKSPSNWIQQNSDQSLFHYLPSTTTNNLCIHFDPKTKIPPYDAKIPVSQNSFYPRFRYNIWMSGAPGISMSTTSSP
mmetsp:Transcript_26484/g.54855  ORF Transcript_26484/g.54855 Transcript_26484/m.54855 type:complete len:111 (+) Transcript_26484:1119-1451(+)